MRKGIWILDHTGDQHLATASGGTVTTIADSDGDVSVSWDALNAFMDDCIQRHGQTPMVSGRIAGSEGFDMLHKPGSATFDMKPEQLRGVEEVLIARPIVGG